MQMNHLWRNSKVWKFVCAQRTIVHWLGADVRPFGFYIPYRYADSVHAPDEADVVGWLEQDFSKSDKEFLQVLERARAYRVRFQEFATADPQNVHRPRFDQDWFPGLDGAIAYSMVRELKPQKIMEVGSGHSTRFLAQAIQDEGLQTYLHSIDPQPRREIDRLCKQVTRSTVEGVALARFRELSAGDILFVDCSHIAMPGSDVDYLFTRVFPELNPGVVVHVHDIFLPYGYPQQWRWRSYNEQNFLLAVLSGGKRYETIFPCAYMRRKFSTRIDQLGFRAPEGSFEASYWLRVRG